LGLGTKSARWTPKLLSDEQKQQHVEACTKFVTAIHGYFLSMLDSIVTMDKTMVHDHTPQMKKQYQHWIKKGQPGSIKAKIHARQTKQMLLAIFLNSKVIYPYIVPRGSTVHLNAAYITKLLGIFIKHLKRRGPPWWSKNGFSIGIKPLFAPLPSSRTG
jgi:hypothetical protein